jgi:1,4-dihydroxy-2-naphthoate octaprenyltransferase
VAGIIGVTLSIFVGWGVLVLGAVGILSGYFYVSQLAPRGVGELTVGLNFGPLMVLGAYYVQARSLDLAPLVASIPVGLLITAILWINEIPDYAADKSVGKNTIVVRVGRRRAADLYGVIMAAAYAWTVAMVAAGQMPLVSLIVLVNLPLSIRAVGIARRHFDTSHDMVAANLSTIRVHMLFGVLMVVAYLVQSFIFS